MSQEKTDHIDPERTDFLATRQMQTQPEMGKELGDTIEEQTDKTELL